jgi:hypothetical protein
MKKIFITAGVAMLAVAGGIASVNSVGTVQAYAVCSSLLFLMVAVGGIKEILSPESQDYWDFVSILREKNNELKEKNRRLEEELVQKEKELYAYAQNRNRETIVVHSRDY